jgi:hypothetical protein
VLMGAQLSGALLAEDPKAQRGSLGGGRKDAQVPHDGSGVPTDPKGRRHQELAAVAGYPLPPTGMTADPWIGPRPSPATRAARSWAPVLLTVVQPGPEGLV